MRELLCIEDVTKVFGGLIAVDRAGFSLETGEIIGLIGPNGAGKTTFLNLISGFYSLDGGRIIHRGDDISQIPMHGRATRGIGRTFQASSLFTDMTVFENALVGSYRIRGMPWWQEMLGGRWWRDETSRIEETERCLDLVGLDSSHDELASDLPAGQQRALGIAIALNSQPEILLLDEPFSGVHSADIDMMVRLLHDLAAEGLAVIVVEHNMLAVMDLSDRMVVLDYGRKIADGVPEVIKENPEVIRAYLGVDPETASLGDLI